MVAEIKIISKSAGSNTKTVTYKPGQKMVGQPNTQYQLVVDGKEGLPQGTKIVRTGKDLIVQFPDGQQFEIQNWSEVQGSSLLANGAESISTSGSYFSTAEISSEIELGAAAEASTESAVAVPAATTGVSTGAVIAALAAVVGIGAAASSGGGGGGSDSGSSTKPSAPSGTLAAGSDTGTQGDAGTNDATPTISGSGGTAGQTIELRDASGAVLASTTVAQDGTWSLTPTNPLPEGSNDLQLVAKDAGGLASDPQAIVIVVDVALPAVPTALDLAATSDTGSSTTDNLTNDTTATITGAAVEPNATVTLYDNDGTTVLGTTTADGSGNWSITTSALSEGEHNLTAKQTDVAGNESGASTPLTVTVDTTPDSALTALDLATASDSGNEGAEFDNLTNDTTPTIDGAGAAANATVTLYDSNGTAVLGTTTADASGNWSITSSTLNDGVHNLTARQTEAAGNQSAASAVLAVTIDATANPPAALDMATASDTGSSTSDNITSTIQPTITGTAEANATVYLYDTDGVTFLGATAADASGNWSITTSELSEGTHNLTAKQIDGAGNQSVASPVLAVTVDTNIASPTALDLRDSSDSGSSNTDDLTNDTTPTITGGAVEANATVNLYQNVEGPAVLIGTTTADGSGNWSITSSALSDGVHYLTATQTDAAGNESAASPELIMEIDATLPALTLDLASFSSDNGVNGTDNVTSVTAPTINGRADGGATVTLFDSDGTTELGTTTASGSGFWSITTPVLSDGVHHLTAQQTDPAGNTSSATTDIMIDTSPANTQDNATSIAGDYQLRPSDFGISDAASGEISAVQINSGGNLFLNGVAIAANQMVSVAQLVGGELEWHAPNLTRGTTIELIDYTTFDAAGDPGVTSVRALSRDISHTSLLNEISGTRFDAGFSGGWQDAYNRAIEQGGHLATFENGGAAEVNARWDAVGYGGEIWVGLEQSSSGAEPDGGWHWITGDTTAPNWGVSEPNNAGAENFGALGASGFINDAGSANGFGIEFENAKFIHTGEAGEVDIMSGTSLADLMNGKGGADVLSGNAGDDRFLTSLQNGLGGWGPDVGTIDGGAGFDVVQLNIGTPSDFASISGSELTTHLTNVEGLHITHTDPNTGTQLFLSASDVEAMSITTDSLYISSDGAGGYGDAVQLAETIGTGPNEWHLTASANNVTTYEYFNVGGASGIKLIVDAEVNVFGGGIS